LRRISSGSSTKARIGSIQTKKTSGALPERATMCGRNLFTIGISPARGRLEQAVNEPQRHHTQKDREP
jgi:hypothetical protein